MPFYYVTHPNMDFSATVEAPSTEKARTEFLDYLERQGRVSRSNRQNLRRNMVADRIMDPNEVMADINLSYGFESTTLQPSRTYDIPPSIERTGIEEINLEIEPPPIEEVPVQVDYPPIRDVPEVQIEEPKVFSPIQQVSLGRRYKHNA